jgi:DNA-binding Xre family transcriptional regulator
METKPTASAAAARKIKFGLVDNKLTRNALAVRAGIPTTTFSRKLDQKPEAFTLKELGDIAEALGIQFEDLFRSAA